MVSVESNGVKNTFKKSTGKEHCSGCGILGEEQMNLRMALDPGTWYLPTAEGNLCAICAQDKGLIDDAVVDHLFNTGLI